MFTQGEVRQLIDQSQIGLAVARIATGWRVAYRDGAGFFVSNLVCTVGPFKSGEKALEVYKARVFNHLFPKV